jgi:GT2 family glycosyltransferase
MVSDGTLPHPMRVSVVVPTYRRPDALRSTLAALLQQDFPRDDYEIVVVDDGSGDATENAVRELAALDERVRYEPQPNSGVATARNSGARAATGDLLIFLDDDMLVEPDHIQAHLAARERHGECLVNGHWEFSESTRAALEQTPFGRYRIALEDDIRARFPRVALDDGRFTITKVTAANLGVSRQAFQKLGGFDERFPYAGYEDQEFSHRAHEAGLRFIYDPAIRLRHNDERVTLEQFGRRYQRGAVTAVYLAALHPAEYGGVRLVLENAPTTRYDPLRLRIKKPLKRLFSSGGGVWLLRALIRELERHAPRSRALPRLYSATIGIFIFRGIREGLQQNPAARKAAIDAIRTGQTND